MSYSCSYIKLIFGMENQFLNGEVKNNKFVQTFGFGSFLMLKLFEYFINKKQDSNTILFFGINTSDILNIVMSCKIMYGTCNIFISKRRLLWTNTKNFDQNKINMIHRL